jgi:hypothetical protein
MNIEIEEEKVVPEKRVIKDVEKYNNFVNSFVEGEQIHDVKKISIPLIKRIMPSLTDEFNTET